MPHLVVAHSLGNDPRVIELLSALSRTAIDQGFNPSSVKAYAHTLDHAVVGGQSHARLAHLTFRLLDKPERTNAVVEAWLRELVTVVRDILPELDALTAGAEFLPEVYVSGTA